MCLKALEGKKDKPTNLRSVHNPKWMSSKLLTVVKIKRKDEVY